MRDAETVTTKSGCVVDKEDAGDGAVKLTVRVPEALLRKCYDAVVDGFNDTVTVPGFNASKKGTKASTKIPMQLLINHVGKKEFQSACVEEALQNSLPEAMELVAATALQDSERITTHFMDMFSSFAGVHSAPCEDMKYEVVVEMEPTVAFTGDHKSLSVKVQSPGDDSTAQYDADKFWNDALKDKSTLRVVTDRGLVSGDAAVVDIEAVRVNDDGTDGAALQGMQQKGVPTRHGRRQHQASRFARKYRRYASRRQEVVRDRVPGRLAAGVRAKRKGEIHRHRERALRARVPEGDGRFGGEDFPRLHLHRRREGENFG